MSPIERTLDKLERLLDLQETYEAYMNAIPTAMMVVDEWFTMVFVNKPLSELTGYTKGQLIGEHISFLMNKEDAKVHREHEREFDRSPRSRVGNHGLKPLIRTVQGKEIPVDISLSTMEIRGTRYHMANIRTIDSIYESLGHVPK